MYIAPLWMLIGCIFLSLSIKRNYLISKIEVKDFNRNIAMLFRFFGVLCILFSFLLFSEFYGSALGIVYLVATFTVASLLQTLLLTFLPSWVSKIFIVLVLLGFTLTFFCCIENIQG